MYIPGEIYMHLPETAELPLICCFLVQIDKHEPEESPHQSNCTIDTCHHQRQKLHLPSPGPGGLNLTVRLGAGEFAGKHTCAHHAGALWQCGEEGDKGQQYWEACYV